MHCFLAWEQYVHWRMHTDSSQCVSYMCLLQRWTNFFFWCTIWRAGSSSCQKLYLLTWSGACHFANVWLWSVQPQLFGWCLLIHSAYSALLTCTFIPHHYSLSWRVELFEAIFLFALALEYSTHNFFAGTICRLHEACNFYNFCINGFCPPPIQKGSCYLEPFFFLFSRLPLTLLISMLLVIALRQGFNLLCVFVTKEIYFVLCVHAQWFLCGDV